MVLEEIQQRERAPGAARRCKMYLVAMIVAILIFVLTKCTLASLDRITLILPRTDLNFKLTQNPQFAVIRKTSNGFPFYIPRYYFLQEKVTRCEVALLEVVVEAEYDIHIQRWYERALGMVGKDLFPEFKNFRQKTRALIADQAAVDLQWIAAFLGEPVADKKDLIRRLVVDISVEYQQLERQMDTKNATTFELLVWRDRTYGITYEDEMIRNIFNFLFAWYVLNVAFAVRHLRLWVHDIEEFPLFRWVRPFLSIEHDYIFRRIGR